MYFLMLVMSSIYKRYPIKIDGKSMRNRGVPKIMQTHSVKDVNAY
jgi:hypothetical protein